MEKATLFRDPTWSHTHGHIRTNTHTYSHTSDSHLPAALGSAVLICSGLNKRHCMTLHTRTHTLLLTSPPPLSHARFSFLSFFELACVSFLNLNVNIFKEDEVKREEF